MSMVASVRRAGGMGMVVRDMEIVLVGSGRWNEKGGMAMEVLAPRMVVTKADELRPDKKTQKRRDDDQAETAVLSASPVHRAPQLLWCKSLSGEALDKSN